MTYFAPTDLDEALRLLAPRDLTVIAGGTDYFASRTPGRPETGLLDVTRIEGLRGIARDGGGWRIGGATRWADVTAADLPPAFDGLKAAAREVGSVQIQNAGTVAGNLCNASPAADGVPPLLTLGAQVELVSSRGIRVLALKDFLTGARQTALAPDELVAAVLIPPPPTHVTSAFLKLGSRRYLVISVSMTAALIGRDGDGAINFARIAVGACSAVACRLPALEAAVIGRQPGSVQVLAEHLSPLSPITDMRGSAEYRQAAAGEQIARCIRQAGGSHG